MRRSHHLSSRRASCFCGLFHYLLLLFAAFAPKNLLNIHVVAEESSTNDTPTIMLANPILQDHLERFTTILNGAPPYNETEYATRFAPSFVEQLPLEAAFLPVLEDLRQMMVTSNGTNNSNSTTWLVTDILDDEESKSNEATVLFGPPEDTTTSGFQIFIQIDPSTDQVSSLLVAQAEPATTLENQPETFQDTLDQFLSMGHSLNYVVADANQCNVLVGDGFDEPTPMASMFKLWVLGAVVDAINDNDKDVTWDQEVYVTDEIKSLPSGTVQDDTTGSNRTVRELAELMISISDNTATDMLMQLVVGREAVEQALEDYGHHDPSLNIPFLSTKELFILKFHESPLNGEPGPLGEEYIAAKDSLMEQKKILGGLENSTIASFGLPIGAAAGGGPTAIQELEWFGSPLDLCHVLVRLYEDEEAARILSINPGIPDEEGLYSYIGFKGGSEPGVLGMAWYLVPSNPNTPHRVVTGTLWDHIDTIDETEAILLFGALRDLSMKETFKDDSTGSTSGGDATTSTDPEGPTDDEADSLDASSNAPFAFTSSLASSSTVLTLLLSTTLFLFPS